MSRFESICQEILHTETLASDHIHHLAMLQGIVSTHGNTGCQAIFASLAALDLAPDTAETRWLAFTIHWSATTSALGRPLPVIAALADFLAIHDLHPGNGRIIAFMSTQPGSNTLTRDPLTNLCNRSYFEEAYQQQVSLARRYHTDLSVLFLDLDDFKEINDTHGHFAGDAALRQVAATIRQTKRTSDLAARYGGEEFVLLMPHTPGTSACSLADRIRRSIESTTIQYQKSIFRVTVSGGVASFPQNATNPEDILELADSAVYLAKGAGKNTISQFKREKRRYLRVPLQQEVTGSLLDDHSPTTFTCEGRDICLGGILCRYQLPIPLGCQLKLSLSLADHKPLLLLGRVVRVVPAGASFDVGISFSFQEIAKTAANEIAQYLKLDGSPLTYQCELDH